jgi:hypothetical protein
LSSFANLARRDVEVFYVHRVLHLTERSARRTPVRKRGFSATLSR